jgi:hypothetical protein
MSPIRKNRAEEWLEPSVDIRSDASPERASFLFSQGSPDSKS